MFAAAGTPAWGTLVYRDDLPNLLHGDRDGERVAQHFKTLAEFLEDDRAGENLPRLERDAVLHVHYHEKALLRPDAQRKLLRGIGLRIHEPDPGCCGLAGAFGFEEEHHEVSMHIGELKLLPAVRSAGADTLLIADGFSCRKQVMDGTGRRPLHAAEVLLTALSGKT